MVKLIHKVGLVSAASLWATGVVCYQTDALNSTWCSSFRAVRFGRAALAVVQVSFDYKWSLRNFEYGSTEYSETIAQVHTRSALCLREMCSRNGGLFIKVGQHIGALDYLLPWQYVKTFKVFHNKAPETPMNRLKTVIQEETGKLASEVFSELDEEPLGAASLAQCHRGVLREDGRVVAVKIQHPDVGKTGYTDLETIDFLVSCVHWLFPNFKFQWLVDEVRRNLPNELNFCYEARNQERFAAVYQHLGFVRVPEVYWELTTPRLLTMQFFEGGKVDDLEYINQHNIDVDEISLNLGKLYSEMIFTQGFIHCDPHPGNILIRPAGGGRTEIVMLDHGLYTELTDDFRLSYCRLWQALIDRDSEAIKRHCLDLNAGELYPLLACMIAARTWENIQGGITKTNRTKSELRAISTNIPFYLPEITQLLDNVPRELLLILKTNDLLRGLEYALGSSKHRQSYITMSKYCVRAIGSYEVKRPSNGLVERWKWRARTSFLLVVLHLYQVWVWCQEVLAL